MALTRAGRARANDRPADHADLDGSLAAANPTTDDLTGAVDAEQRSATRSGSFSSLSTLCLLALVFVAGQMGAAELHDNSFLTHLATGRWITSGHLGSLWMGASDPYTFTSGGGRWIVQSWLASVIYDGAERVAGAAGIRLLIAALTMALTACLWRLTAPARTLVPRVASVAIALAIGSSTWNERPYMFGLVFLAVSLLAADGVIRARWLIPIGWLWVNIHGSFPIGIAALALITVGTWLDTRDAKRELHAARNLVIGCVLGGVLSPVGPALLTFPVELLSRHDVLAHIEEWKSPNYSLAWVQMFVAFGVLCALGLARRWSFRGALPLVVFAAMGAMSARNVVVSSVIFVPILAKGLADLGSIRSFNSPRFRVANTALVVLIPLLVLSTAAAGDYRLEAYPATAVDWMETRGLLDGSVRIAEQDFVGNYLEFRYGGTVSTFMDDRYDMHDRALVEDYFRMTRGTEGWSEALDRWGIDVVLWNAHEELTQLLAATPGWQIAVVTGTDTVSGTATPYVRVRTATDAPYEAAVGDRYVVICRSGVTRCFAS